MMTFWSIVALAACGAVVIMLGIAFEKAMRWGESKGIVDRSHVGEDEQ